MKKTNVKENNTADIKKWNNDWILWVIDSEELECQREEKNNKKTLKEWKKKI